MLKQLTIALIAIFCTNLAVAQSVDLTYYLPDISYDKKIPTPESFLGYQIGDWHVSHDQLRFYMQALAEASDRITIEEYARSYENRPLLLLTITSQKNHNRIDEILAQRQTICDPKTSSSLDISKMPAVIYQGYSIHGNEPSGANASMAVAYYLAAGQSDDIDALLDNVVILLDPSFNPDGLHRFSTWVNTHKNATLTANSADREYHEAWPRGRTNHYWFDLNRDWLLLQHPESRGRIRNFHKWKPNILTDHHEMGTNSTFFFMPGIPTRTNPLTPQRNQDLTGEIAKYHVKALDEIGSLYYTEESFDDFYYGKGSTYPDANGCIGILFEQASSRGHIQESINGELTFPFTIRNQVTTSLSTQAAAVGLREDLLAFQRDFYNLSVTDGKKDPVKAYVFGGEDSDDPARVDAFINTLLQHDIEVHTLRMSSDVAEDQEKVVLMDQPQYRMIKAIFGEQTTFEDSLFYDVSGWTLPHAYNISYKAVDAKGLGELKISEKYDHPSSFKGRLFGEKSNYGYILMWGDYYAPAAAFDLMNQGLRMKVSQEAFDLKVWEGLDMNFPAGSVFIPVQNQSMSSAEIFEAIGMATREHSVKVMSIPTGKTSEGPDMGSNILRPLEQPEVMLVVGSGTSSYDAGELWHLFDQRYQIPVTKVEADDISRTDLSRYTAILMGDGNYSSISSSGVDKIKDWTREGGTLVLTRGAINWASGKGLVAAKRKTGAGGVKADKRPYDKASADRGSGVIGGALFEIELDLTHPLAFGYSRDKLPVFRRGTSFYKPTQNPYATPGRYTDDPLLSGYINKDNLETMKGSASIWVGGLGGGRVICFADNPSFRAYWWGTQKLLANAVFFGSAISGSTVERAPSQQSQTGNENEESHHH